MHTSASAQVTGQIGRRRPKTFLTGRYGTVRPPHPFRLSPHVLMCSPSVVERGLQANYINALAVSVSPFFEPAMPMTLGGFFVTLGGFWYDIFCIISMQSLVTNTFNVRENNDPAFRKNDEFCHG
jgi:hypothetical protein